MKTTLDIPDSLLREARKVAARERTTLRALVEQGLRQVVTEKRRRAEFRLREASFKGVGCIRMSPTQIGVKFAISFTRDTAPDRARYEHSGLRAPCRLPVS
jgi:hypothetical protein